MLRTMIISVAVVHFMGGCDAPDADTLADARIEGAEEYRPSAVDVAAVGDPFLAELDHAWIGPVGSGHAIVGYDTHDNEIGRISIHPLGPNLLRITHNYPRPCDTATTERECADVWEITLNLAGDPDQHSADIYQTLPGDVFHRRQSALLVLVDTPDQAGSPLLCTFGILASGAACFATPPPWVVGTCPAAVLGAVCACREGLENWDEDIDLDAVCGKD